MAASLGATLVYVNQNRTSFETRGEQAEFEYRTVARLAAESGFEILQAKLTSTKGAYRGLSSVEILGGSYTMAASGPPTGPITLSVTGAAGESQYSITGEMTLTSTSLLDGMVVDGALKKFSFKDLPILSGIDTNPDGSLGSGTSVHAVLTTDADARKTILAELSSNQARGVAGYKDVVNQAPAISPAVLGAMVLGYAGPKRVYYAEKQKFKNVKLGSAEDPKVVIVDGDVTLDEGSVGYGALYVAGELDMSKNARWEGLIVVERNGGKHKIGDDSRIYGAIVLRTVSSLPEDPSDTASDRGLPGGHFDVDVFDDPGDTKEIYHEHRYDDDFNTKGIDLKAPSGCKTNGGLCWSSIMTGEGAVFVEFLNPARGYGSYTIAAGSNTYGPKTVGAVNVTGRVEAGLPNNFMLASSKLSTFKVTFDHLCALQISSPGASIADAAGRNGAFAVRVFRAVQVGNAWQKGDLVYEVSAYHHTGYGMWVDEGGAICDPSKPNKDVLTVATGKDMEIEIKKNARLQYSSLALGRLSSIFPEIDPTKSGLRLAKVKSGFVR